MVWIRASISLVARLSIVTRIDLHMIDGSVVKTSGNLDESTEVLAERAGVMPGYVVCVVLVGGQDRSHTR